VDLELTREHSPGLMPSPPANADQMSGGAQGQTWCAPFSPVRSTCPCDPETGDPDYLVG
jgi:hypothetical protein